MWGTGVKLYVKKKNKTTMKNMPQSYTICAQKKTFLNAVLFLCQPQRKRESTKFGSFFIAKGKVVRNSFPGNRRTRMEKREGERRRRGNGES